MGSIFRLPPRVAPTRSLLDRLAADGLARIGATPAGEDYARCDFRPACALIFGGEGAGLPVEVTAALDRRVGVPMREEVESLSVGAAAAVLLFEAARQRRARS